MKKLLPLIAASGLLAACGGHCADGHCNNGHKYHSQGYHDRDSGHISSSDPLSERSLGSVRGHHNEYWENSRGHGDYDDPDYVYYVPRYNYYYYPGSYWRR